MNDKITVPIEAEITSIAGLQKFSQALASTYIEIQRKTIESLSEALDKAFDREFEIRTKLADISLDANQEKSLRKELAQVTSTIRRTPGLIQKKENLLDFISAQSALADELLGEMAARSARGIKQSGALPFLNAGLGARSAFRAFTGRDITGLMDAATLKNVRGGQELLNREINRGRALYTRKNLASDSKSAWLAFERSKEFGGDLQAFLEDESVDIGYRLQVARQAEKLLNKAFSTRFAAGMLSAEDNQKFASDKEWLQKFLRSNQSIEKYTRLMSAGIGYIGAMLGPGAAGAAIGNKIVDLQAGYYGSATPYTYVQQKRAQWERNIGGVGGGLLGAIGGNITGNALIWLLSLLGAPVSGGLSTLLAGGLTVAGGFAGGTAGALWGGEREKRLAAVQTSQEEAIKYNRWRALYGNNMIGNYQFARLAEATGYVSAADIEGMASTRNTFMAAAAFGGVGDNQWLGLSMMPNYFAALVSGADEATLLAAYQKDLDMLGPGLGQYFTGMVPGLNENIRALASRRDATSRLMNDIAWGAADEAMLTKYYTDSYESAKYRMGRENISERVTVNMRGARTGDPNYFDYTVGEYGQYYETIKSRLGREPTEKEMKGFNTLYSKQLEEERKERRVIDELSRSMTKYDLNIVIGDDVQRVGTVYADNNEVQQMSNFNFMVGGQ